MVQRIRLPINMSMVTEVIQWKWSLNDLIRVENILLIFEAEKLDSYSKLRSFYTGNPKI